MESKFVADSMLGKLAKWLRVMGYDTHYQTFYKMGELLEITSGGRRLLSRYRQSTTRDPDSMLVHSDHVKDQLKEIRSLGLLTPDRSKWFSRCLICNDPLRTAEAAEAREHVPEYVFHQTPSGIRVCPSCCRFFWPGSHKEKMMRQLEKWGF